DGISALVRVLQLAAELKAAGSTLLDRLDEIAAEHGLYVTSQLSIRVDDPGAISDAISRLSTEPPSRLGGCAVTEIDDLRPGSGDLPPTEGVRLWLDDQTRIVVRPSGTEPKLKCYLEVVSDTGDDVAAARARAAEELAGLERDLRTALALG